MDKMLKMMRELKVKFPERKGELWDWEPATPPDMRMGSDIPVHFRSFVEKPIFIGGTLFVKDEEMANDFVRELNENPELKKKFQEVIDLMIEGRRLRGR